MGKLAITGGTPVRTKQFKSFPHINNFEIDAVVKAMKELRFSKFVGSPHEHIEEILETKSINLDSDEPSFLGGKYIKEFEAKWSELMNIDYSISVNSATSGLITALSALSHSSKSEVITSPFSFTATSGVVTLSGYTPIFADIDLDTFCLDPLSVVENYDKSKITVILPVYWNGNAGEIERICDFFKDKCIHIIEDAAQAVMNKVGNKFLGTLGDMGVFSFNEPKNIMTGEGGMIVTNNKNYAVACRLIRNHGENIGNADSQNYMGYNFRLTELQAVIGIEQIKKLRPLNEMRKTNYEFLIKETFNFGEFMIPQKITCSEYYPYCAGFRWLSNKAGLERDKLATALRAEGIPVATGIPRLLCDHPYYWNIKKTHVPNARFLQQQYLGFFQIGHPNYIDDIWDIVHAIKKIMENKNELDNMEIKASTFGR